MAHTSDLVGQNHWTSPAVDHLTHTGQRQQVDHLFYINHTEFYTKPKWKT